MRDRLYARRRLANYVFEGFCTVAALAAVALVVAVIGYVVVNGAAALNLAFFTHVPKPVGEVGGGVANAIIGTLIIAALASAIALPIGLFTGTYLAEYGENQFAATVRLLADVLTGIPSIVVGILAYELVVVRMQRFSALAGAVALAVLMLPTIVRTTEEMLRLVPRALREASYALGIPRWRTILGVVLPTASSGLVTGIMLAAARASGETAPLLFTAFGNNFWSVRVDQPMAALPLQIYQYAISPYDDWHRQAWAGALVLVLLVSLITVVVRALTASGVRERSA